MGSSTQPRKSLPSPVFSQRVLCAAFTSSETARRSASPIKLFTYLSENTNAIYNLNSAAFAAFLYYRKLLELTSPSGIVQIRKNCGRRATSGGRCPLLFTDISKDLLFPALFRPRTLVSAGHSHVRTAKMRGKTNFILHIFVSRGHHDDVVVEIRAIFHGKFAIFRAWLHNVSSASIFRYCLRKK